MFLAHATPAPSTKILYLYSESQDIHKIIVKIYITKVKICKCPPPPKKGYFLHFIRNYLKNSKITKLLIYRGEGVQVF